MVRDFVSQENYHTHWPDAVRAFFLRYPNPLATHVLSVDVLDRRIVPAQTPSYIYPDTPSHEPSHDPSSSSRRPIIPWRQQPHDDNAPSSSSSPPLVLRTTRLILKQGTLPRWAPKGVIKNTLSWVLEESEIELDYQLHQPFSTGDKDDPQTRQGRLMRIWTRNLDHTTAMAVTEGIEMAECLREMDKVQSAGLPAVESDTSSRGLGLWGGSSREASTSDSPSELSRSAPVILPLTRMTTTARVESNLAFSMLRNRIEKFGLNRVRAHKDNSKEGLFWAISRLRNPLGSHRSPSLGTLSPSQSAFPDDSHHGPSSHYADAPSPAPSAPRRLLAALRPPFLDGYPVGPVQRLRIWAARWWETWSGKVRGTLGGTRGVGRLESSEPQGSEEAEHAAAADR